MQARIASTVVGLAAAAWPVFQQGAAAADAVPVLSFDKVCGHEKWKKVSFDAYLDLQKMNCKGTRNKRANKLTNAECSIATHASAKAGAKPGAASVTAWIPVVDGDQKQNRMLWPADNYKSADIKIHDNTGNAVPTGGKLRFTGSRRDIEGCQFSVQQIDLAK